MYEIDEEQIRKWWSIFKSGNKLVEIRLLGNNTYSGYFKDVDTLITQLRPMLDHNNTQFYGNLQAYFTLNDINEDLYSREQHDRFIKKPKSTTIDGNVVRRSVVLVDLDPSRTAGVSASDEEYEKAHLKAVEIYKYLIGEGFNEPIITTSGNGYHVYLPCDMPNDDEHNDLVKRFLQGLSSKFSDGVVEIDEKVFNPARIDKLIGTWAKKGSDTMGRRWRISRILKVPKDLSPNDDSLFEKIAMLAPKEEPKVAPNRRPMQQGMNQPFDLVTWMNQHGIVYRESKQGASTKYELQHCPWEDTHSHIKEYESALFVDMDGKITYSCFHSHCKSKTWFDFRLFYEPDAYNKPLYQPQPIVIPQQSLYMPQKPKFMFKEENEELGKKWLKMSMVKKVDISSIRRFETGIKDLDNTILGLAEGEITLFSGSNGSGKTSFLNTLLLNIMEQNVPCALWSGEFDAPILNAWIQMAAAGRRNLKPSKFKQGQYYVPNDVSSKIDEWMEDRYLLYNNEYGNTFDQIILDMEKVAKMGVKVFAIDNLFSLNLDFLNGDKNAKQTEAILRIKKFAKDTKSHVILVAHPRKTTNFLRKNDISGSGDLSNASDNVFIIHRVNNDFFKSGAEFFGQGYIQQFQGYGNVIEVCKNRMFGVADLMVGMHYEMESRRFKNTIDEDVRYGWEKIEDQSTIHFERMKGEAQNGYIKEKDDNLPFGEIEQGEVPF